MAKKRKKRLSATKLKKQMKTVEMIRKKRMKKKK